MGVSRVNKLNELIHTLCPDGVEYYPLGDVCNLVTGATPSKTKKEYWENGTISWMSSGEVNNRYVFETENKITRLGYDSASTTIVPIHSVVIALAGQGKTRGKVAITEIELCTNQSLCSIICGERVYYKFLFHYLESKYLELRAISNGDGARGGLSLKILAPYKIPVPPLQVQKEIVRILDNFTALTTELIAELTAELAARKTQYKYYRELLLAFDNTSARWLPVESLCDISRGRVISKDYIRDHPGEYPVYSSQTENDGVLGRISEYTNEGECLTWTTDGANAGTIFYRNGRFNITNVCGLLKPKCRDINLRYLYFVLGTIANNYVSRGMGNPKLMSNVMAKIKVPVPSVKEQKYIVSVLSKLDVLYADLSNDLHAEIEASQKQYAYYRDKLLTFKEVKA